MSWSGPALAAPAGGKPLAAPLVEGNAEPGAMCGEFSKRPARLQIEPLAPYVGGNMGGPVTTLIVLALVFVFVALRLWSVLGRRTGP